MVEPVLRLICFLAENETLTENVSAAALSSTHNTRCMPEVDMKLQRSLRMSQRLHISSSHNITHFGGLADRPLYGASLMSLSPANWRCRLLAVFGAGHAAAAGQVEGRHIAQSPILNRLEGWTQDHV